MPIDERGVGRLFELFGLPRLLDSSTLIGLLVPSVLADDTGELFTGNDLAPALDSAARMAGVL